MLYHIPPIVGWTVLQACRRSQFVSHWRFNFFYLFHYVGQFRHTDCPLAGSDKTWFVTQSFDCNRFFIWNRSIDFPFTVYVSEMVPGTVFGEIWMVHRRSSSLNKIFGNHRRVVQNWGSTKLWPRCVQNVSSIYFSQLLCQFRRLSRSLGRPWSCIGGSFEFQF